MPRDSSGVYSLPNGYLAKTGETIQPSQHNPPLEDIASALTGSLPRAGTAPMLGPIRMVDGSVSAPAVAFNSSTSTGLFKTTNGFAVAINGTQVLEFSAGGLIGLPIGTPIAVLDDTLPDLCVWADGRNIARSSYPALFTKWGTKYGAGDGTTTFGMPDLRGRILGGRDNIGGTDANRLASVPAASGTRLTTGSVLGENLHTLTSAENATHFHTMNFTNNFNDVYTLIVTDGIAVASGVTGISYVVTYTTTTTPNSININGNTQNSGSGTAHNTVQQTLLCNIAIYAGA